jgi:hypothetical protein
MLSISGNTPFNPVDMAIVLDWYLSPSDIVNPNDDSFLVAEVTSSFLNSMDG